MFQYTAAKALSSFKFTDAALFSSFIDYNRFLILSFSL